MNVNAKTEWLLLNTDTKPDEDLILTMFMVLSALVWTISIPSPT